MPAVLTERKIITDIKTGEVLEDQEKTVKTEKSSEPNFIKLYIDAWCAFKEIKGINTSFLYSLLPYMSYAENKQLIFLNGTLKKIIGKKLEWSEKTLQVRFSKELKKICEKNILKKVDVSTYQVNPELIGKGEWKDIKNLVAEFHLETGEVTHYHRYIDDSD